MSIGKDYFSIKITFVTGNSFGLYTEQDQVGAVWPVANLHEAKEALKRIHEHYKAYKAATGWSRAKSVEPEGTENWYYKGEYKRSWQACILVPCNGIETVISAFWTGYFEELIEAEIILNTEEEELNK